MFLSRVFFVLVLAIPSGAVRTRPTVVGSGGKVCSVSENAEDGTRYNIRFALSMEEVGGCSAIKNCNFFSMEKLTKLFLETAKTPEKGSMGRCRCNLKTMQSGDSAVLPGADDDTILLDFMSYAEEPCDETWCWYKYNEFLAAASRKEGQNASSEAANANNWKFGCEEGDASLAGLKTFNQFVDEASEEDRERIREAANQFGFLPQVDEIQGSEDVEEEEDEEDFFGVELAPMVLKGADDESADAVDIDDEDFSEDEANIDDETVVAQTTLSKTTSKTLYKAVSLLEQIEAKLAKMMAVALVFSRLTALMKVGKVEEALRGDWEVVEVLWTNMRVLARLLLPKQEVFAAFAAACEVTSAEPSVVQDFLKASEKATEIQKAVVSGLMNLHGLTIVALQEFSKHDADADMKAQHIVRQMQALKDALKEARIGLKRATVAIAV